MRSYFIQDGHFKCRFSNLCHKSIRIPIDFVDKAEILWNYNGITFTPFELNITSYNALNGLPMHVYPLHTLKIVVNIFKKSFYKIIMIY